MTTPDPNGPVARLLRYANEVHALAGRCGRKDLAEVLAACAARWKDECTDIVVAGAQKRGKSRLLNTLVGHPDLVPVDADVATNCFLSLRRGPKLTAVVHRSTDAGPVQLPITVESIPDYASMRGDAGKRRDVVSVDITLDNPLLDGLRLLDTPGVDSLTVGHRQVTVAMLQRADALLFTLSAQDQPVLRHELEFLAEAAERVQAIAFVLTKVEDSANWRTLMEENQARLRTFVTEAVAENPARAVTLTPLLSAPWIPVSSKLAEAAEAKRREGRLERADALRARSGMDALERHLRAFAEGRESARGATVVAAALSVLSSLSTTAQDDVAAGSDDEGDVTARLAQVEADLEGLTELAARRRAGAVANTFLGREVAGIVAARVAEIRQPYENAIATLKKQEQVDRYMAELPMSVQRSLEAAWSQIVYDVESLARRTLDAFARDLGLDPVEFAADPSAMPNLSQVQVRKDASADVPGEVDMVRDVLPSASIGLSLGGFAASLLGPVGFLLVAPAIGAAIFMGRRSMEKVQRNQAAIRGALRDQFAAVSREMTLDLERMVATWRVGVEQAADESLMKRRKELEGRRAELKAASARSAADRRKARESGQDRIAAIETLTRRGQELRRELATAVAALGAGQEASPAAP
ncbi:dynamin family protein [Planomonospora sp. ID91781]|uniref:GTP-binding protein n=1 Tax=Planomonospora sphaerica TaxID=161355 RepID=A0A161LIN7_9ACTN|nr:MULTISPECIES: dynamin family protein [Planomonospora]MBG0823840.1 dynamin family protein [Planomonospora sp. ID91781]GAT68594.1 GTP-binding protein [Planomonospora sphaerica]